MSTSSSLLERRRTAVPRGVGNLCDCFAASASGAVIRDVEGREYIDFVGGIGVNNVGHCHPDVVAAVRDQAGKLLHSCFHIAMYEPYVALAERLAALTPGDFPKKTLFLNSGAEAVENAVKIARRATGRQGVIAFETGFHGRTLLAMSLTSKVNNYKRGFGPFAPEVYRMPFAYCYRCPMGRTHPECGLACAEHLESFFIDHVAPDQVACMIVEPLTGEGGFIVPPPGYFKRLMELCHKHGIVFISDEIQTGVGRTGAMFAMEQHGVAADITLVAKSLGGGMPISAVVGRAELMDAPDHGGLGGTYGGNPVSCAAGLAVLDVFEKERLLEKGRALGDSLRATFTAWADEMDCIGDIRGLGPMLALELVRDRATREPAGAETKAIVARCLEKGLLILSCGHHGNVLRMLMPLVIGDDELARGLAILRDAMAETFGGQVQGAA